MGDYFLSEGVRLRRTADLEVGRNRFKGVKRTTKINILSILILVLAAGLFFSIFSGHFARAEQVPAKNLSEGILPDPLGRIKGAKNINDKKLENKVCIDEKITVLDMAEKDSQNKKDDERQEKYLALVRDYPMAEMVPYISQRDSKTASFLVAIAKKESDWGKHSPSLDGRDCHNYWGYKGGYHLVQGYSCFDSAEQAVKVVGDRIDQLVSKNIDTPQKMLVWKCGGSCQGDTGAASWVAAVSGYFYRLIS